MHQADMPPTDCLISATINAADFIAVPRDPLEDVTAYQDVEFVMKDGSKIVCANSSSIDQ